MNQKVMVIVKSDIRRFLLLKTGSKQSKSDRWFVITGDLEKDESFEKAAERKVKEETGLRALKIKPTRMFFEYEFPPRSGKLYHEKVFIALVKSKDPKLSKNYLDFKWLKKEDFLKEIDWEYEKDKLDKILEES